MSHPYEEILDGLLTLRLAPTPRHELICHRLHSRVAASLVPHSVSQLLPPRTEIRCTPNFVLRPDLALVTTAHHKPWLVAEIISADDHETDTVLKKTFYEDHRIPRLWMIDSRYDNVEVYHGTPYGLKLQPILAGREVLTDHLLPGLAVPVECLFQELPPDPP